MSLINGGDVSLFPTEWVRACISEYKKKHGKDPKVLVLSTEDLIDYRVGCSLPSAKSLGLEIITHGDYLKSGEMDLATGIKESK